MGIWRSKGLEPCMPGALELQSSVGIEVWRPRCLKGWRPVSLEA